MSDSGHTIGEKYDDIHYRCKQEIERLQAELAESQKSGRQAAEAYQSAGEELFKLDKEFEMAKASMIPERLRIARLMAELEQAKERVLFVERELAAAIVARDLNHEQWRLVNKEWCQAQDAIQKQAVFYNKKVLEIEEQAKERERQLLIDLEALGKALNIDAEKADWVIAKLGTKVKELESANALAQQENIRLREALTEYADEHNWNCPICMGWIGTVDMKHGGKDSLTPCSLVVWRGDKAGPVMAEAALTAPPTSGRHGEHLAVHYGTTANTDMTKVTNREPAKEK